MAEAPDSLLESIKALLGELPHLFSDRVHLLALELKRAGRALGQIVGLLVIAIIFLLTAWVTLWVGVMVLLLRVGLPLGYAVLAVLVFNLCAAMAALLGIRKLARWLTLPATVRRLTLALPPSKTAEPSREPQPY